MPSSFTFSPLRSTSSLPWAIGFAALLVMLQLLPEHWQLLLRYDRSAVDQGEWWRLLSGNLVHLGWAHLALNGAALLIGAWLFAAGRTPVAWALALLVCGLAVNVGLHLFSPDVYWCVGLSGILHGFLLLGALDWALRGDRLGWVLLAVWIGKVVWEQLQGASPVSEGVVGGAVITEAHLWGLLGGALYALAELLWRHRQGRV